MARPEKELPVDIPLSLRSLAIEMRDARKDSGLTISELATKISYSTTAVSQATSGKTVPSWDLVEAFVKGCGYDGDMEHWKRAHRDARRDTKGITSSEDTGENPLPRLALVVPRPRQRLRRPPEPSVSPLQPDGLLALVQQAREFERQDKRVTSVTSADHMHTALALCTTAEDVIELMNELVRTKGMSLQELEERSRKHYPISNTTFTQVLNGTSLPTTELLHIFLSACGLEEDRTVMWHFTVTRIRISQMRQRERQGALRFRRRSNGARRIVSAIRKESFFISGAAAVAYAVATGTVFYKSVLILW
ncbi:transcriptional regulator with XRE-family HTH domain [Streptomyces aurantiacus]|uniref:helix-turn-helix domain-containing protein n=1 Tax=Streptomyces aurantiacus TaxID=47760 RepID=UPI00278CD7C4|nr:helix-turn-helix transcriptional regulator [Streptomyces aurantiacus]MDQ0780145.1 transcriptional regulator with XRE-family HTH domain [Streptomyces aurantiacus]